MSLVKTSLLNGIAVMVRMLTLLGINKILAIYVGPAGFAVVGQFYNAVQMITTFASGAINIGVVRYTAEHAQDEVLLRKTWQTSGTIALYGSIVASLLIIIFHQQLAVLFLKDSTLGGVFIWFGAALVFFVFNTLLLAILNGKKEIRRYVVANITGSLLSLVLTTWMAITYKLYGSLVALGIYQSIAFVVTLSLCLRTNWFKLSFLYGEIDWDIARNLAKYTVMALTSAIFVPLSHILIRNHIGSNISWVAAGYWEAMWKFSSAYLLFITSTLSVYYLPRISELKKTEDLRAEIYNCFKFVIPISIAGGILAYNLRDIIISILFTGEFSAIRDLFFWQLIGDTLKVASWILGFVYAAKGFVKWYVASEIFSCLTFYLLVVFLQPKYGLEASAIAHAMNYLIYFCIVYVGLRPKGYVR
jgi:polysaccharide transporter, PST family